MFLSSQQAAATFPLLESPGVLGPRYQVSLLPCEQQLQQAFVSSRCPGSSTARRSTRPTAVLSASSRRPSTCSRGRPRCPSSCTARSTRPAGGPAANPALRHQSHLSPATTWASVAVHSFLTPTRFCRFMSNMKYRQDGPWTRASEQVLVRR